jgi:hypothetical protein
MHLAAAPADSLDPSGCQQLSTEPPATQILTNPECLHETCLCPSPAMQARRDLAGLVPDKDRERASVIASRDCCVVLIQPMVECGNVLWRWSVFYSKLKWVRSVQRHHSIT